MPVSWKEVVLGPTLISGLKLLHCPPLQRSMENPVSFVELSDHVRSISFLDIVVATRLLGAAGVGTGVGVGAGGWCRSCSWSWSGSWRRCRCRRRSWGGVGVGVVVASLPYICW